MELGFIVTIFLIRFKNWGTNAKDTLPYLSKAKTSYFPFMLTSPVMNYVNKPYITLKCHILIKSVLCDKD